MVVFWGCIFCLAKKIFPQHKHAVIRLQLILLEDIAWLESGVVTPNLTFWDSVSVDNGTASAHHVSAVVATQL